MIMAVCILLFVLTTAIGSFTPVTGEPLLSYSNDALTGVVERIINERMTDMESNLRTKFEQDIFVLKRDISVLNRENSILKHDNEAVKSDVATLEKENKILKTKVDYIANEIEILKFGSSESPPVHPDRDTKRIEAFRRVAPYHPCVPQVAFQARVNRVLTNLGPDQTIVFERVDFNIGNNYNPATGVFTCEIPGLYVFHINMFVNPGKYIELFIMKNGQNNHPFYVGAKEHLGEDSTMALIQLEKGDTVWLKTDEYHSSGNVAHAGNTCMSGFLLYPKQ